MTAILSRPQCDKGKRSKLIYFEVIWIYDTWDVIANSTIYLNFILTEKLTELIWLSLCLLTPFVQVHFPIQLLITFTSDLKYIIFDTFHDVTQFCFVFELLTNCDCQPRQPIRCNP